MSPAGLLPLRARADRPRARAPARQDCRARPRAGRERFSAGPGVHQRRPREPRCEPRIQGLQRGLHRAFAETIDVRGATVCCGVRLTSPASACWYRPGTGIRPTTTDR
jgi:hypothetical protein